MKLYEIQASQMQEVFGDPMSGNRVQRVVFNIAQKPDCSAFLFITDEDIGLTPINVIPEGYDYTYRQEWGLTTNKESVDRALNDIREKFLELGFTYSGGVYHCDTVFQSQVQAFLLAWQVGMLPANSKVDVRKKDNTTVQLSQSEVLALAGALMAHVQGTYAKIWNLKDTLR